MRQIQLPQIRLLAQPSDDADEVVPHVELSQQERAKVWYFSELVVLDLQLLQQVQAFNSSERLQVVVVRVNADTARVLVQVLRLERVDVQVAHVEVRERRHDILKRLILPHAPVRALQQSLRVHKKLL